MTEAGWTVCIECGMMCEAVEYHPYAACLMFKQCLNSETVRANLQAVRDDSYQQGRVAGLREAAEMVEDDCYIEGGELLPDYKHRCKHNVNQKELAGKIRFRANDLAQQAQEGGVGDGKAVGNETA